MNVARLRGNKRRVYEILNSTDNGRNLLALIQGDPTLIVSYGSIKTFIDRKANLKNLLAILLTGSLYIINYLKDIKDHNLVQEEYIKVLNDATTTQANIGTAITDFFNEKEITIDVIKKFINDLDTASDIDTAGNSFTNIVGVSVFKQIYTMMYNFVLECNGITKEKRLKTKGGYTASTNMHSEEYEVIMPEDIKIGGKKDQVIKWISSRWNWTLPICCFDKIIHCYSGYFEIANNVHKYLPTIKYLSGVLKCSAESFLNCYDVGFVSNSVILRTVKQIKNDGTGLYLSARPTNRTYNFHNLRVKGDNSEQKSWYKLFINGKLMDMITAEQNYNRGIKASSLMKPFNDPKVVKTSMEVEKNQVNQNGQVNQNPQNPQNQEDEEYKIYAANYRSTWGDVPDAVIKQNYLQYKAMLKGQQGNI